MKLNVRKDELNRPAVLDVLRAVNNVSSNHAAALLALILQKNSALTVFRVKINDIGRSTPVADPETIIKIIECCPKVRCINPEALQIRVDKTKKLLHKSKKTRGGRNVLDRAISRASSQHREPAVTA